MRRFDSDPRLQSFPLVTKSAAQVARKSSSRSSVRASGNIFPRAEQNDFRRASSRSYFLTTPADTFSVRFPGLSARVITILIGIQLYFVMYMKQLSSRLMPDDPGWDVPWMTMDQSMLARTMLFVSLVLLPGFAALFVMVQVATQLFRNSSFWHPRTLFNNISVPSRAQLVLMLVGFFVSLCLSILCWKYRPKLTEPVAPSEVLEDQGSGI
jgi:hypothetical protein